MLRMQCRFDTVIRMLNHTELAVVFSGAQEITAEELIRFCSFRVSKETKGVVSSPRFLPSKKAA